MYNKLSFVIKYINVLKKYQICCVNKYTVMRFAANWLSESYILCYEFMAKK